MLLLRLLPKRGYCDTFGRTTKSFLTIQRLLDPLFDMSLSINRSGEPVNDSNQPSGKQPFPTFASLAEAEAYTDKIGDAYYEICYHLEGGLNVCLKTMHDLYANAPANKRPKMQTGVVREIICPDGWPKHLRTRIYTLAAFGRFRHEDTCHAYTVNEALKALTLESENDGSLRNAAFDRRTFEPLTAADAEEARSHLLRLCDWIECRLHYGTHVAWYGSPDCFSADADRVHLANIGIAQRHLATFSERDRKRWEAIHERAAQKYQADLKAWGTVGKVQHDPNHGRGRIPPLTRASSACGLWSSVTTGRTQTS